MGLAISMILRPIVSAPWVQLLLKVYAAGTGYALLMELAGGSSRVSTAVRILNVPLWFIMLPYRWYRSHAAKQAVEDAAKYIADERVGSGQWRKKHQKEHDKQVKACKSWWTRNVSSPVKCAMIKKTDALRDRATALRGDKGDVDKGVNALLNYQCSEDGEVVKRHEVIL
jgi:hypothetical protein